MSDPFRRPTFGSAVIYKNPAAALEWLQKAFGFERTMAITDPQGKLVHSEMRYGNGYLMVGNEWNEKVASPASVGGCNTQSIHILIEGDIDAHCARARAAGAVIVQEPADQFYGDRTYSARDLEGHVWAFGQNLRYVTREEAERVSGLKIDGWV
jgi:uncharacterized glyoxalase superfamily protein PhnB